MTESTGHLTPQEAAEIKRLITELADEDPIKREHARKTLVKMKNKAVQSLIKILRDARAHVRWESAKALGSIGDPAAAVALVGALEDRDTDVRWLAGEGLIALGRSGLEPLLAMLADRPKSAWLREGAHHVFHDLAKKKSFAFVKPLLAALDDEDPELAVPLAVSTVQKALKP
jgi:HEAT repeat protein